MTYLEFSKLIKEIRIKKGLTQKEMAYLIPINTITYNRVENGTQEANFYTLKRISEILNIDLNIIKIDTIHESNYD